MATGSAFGDLVENAIRDWLGFDTQPALQDTYLALLTAATTEGASATGLLANEVTATEYSRQVVNQDGTAATPTTPHWTTLTGTPEGIENAQAVSFPTATSLWGTISHFAIVNGSTGATGTQTVVLLGTASTAKSISTNDQYKVNAGDLNFEFD